MAHEETQSTASMGVFWGASAAAPKAAHPTLPPPERLRTQPRRPRQRDPRDLSRLPPSGITDVGAGSGTAGVAAMTGAPNLRAVLKTVIAVLRREMAKPLSQFDMQFLARFYPDSVRAEHEAYFAAASVKRRRKRHAEQAQRIQRAVATVEGAGSQYWYPFDRSRIRRSTQSKQERAMKAAKDKWTSAEDKAMQSRLRRFEHVLSILQEEQRREVEREVGLFERQDPIAYRRALVRVSKERAEAADWIVRVLEEYHLLSEAEVADYLRTTLRVVRDYEASRFGEAVEEAKREEEALAASRSIAEKEAAAAARAVAVREEHARHRGKLDAADRILLVLRQRVREVAFAPVVEQQRMHMDTVAAFKRCDGDGDGKLTVGEFQRALKTLGLALSARETAEAVAALGFVPASLAPGAPSRLGQAGRQAMGSFPREGCVDYAALLDRVEAHEEFTTRG